MTGRTTVIIGLVIIASLFIAGCTWQKPQQTTPTPMPTNTAQLGLVIQATPARVPQSINEGPHAPDHEFFGFNVTIENIDARNARVSPDNFQIKDLKGEIDGVAVAPVQTAGVSMLSTTTMQPGDTANGLVILDVPRGHQWTKLVYYSGSNATEIPLRVY
jgi:hypothetical protein